MTAVCSLSKALGLGLVTSPVFAFSRDTSCVILPVSLAAWTWMVTCTAGTRAVDGSIYWACCMSACPAVTGAVTKQGWALAHRGDLTGAGAVGGSLVSKFLSLSVGTCCPFVMGMDSSSSRMQA